MDEVEVEGVGGRVNVRVRVGVMVPVPAYKRRSGLELVLVGAMGCCSDTFRV